MNLKLVIKVIKQIRKGEYCDPAGSRPTENLSETQCTANTCKLLQIFGNM
jgi:hypothetical protein